jgi:hypothetical protein
VVSSVFTMKWYVNVLCAEHLNTDEDRNWTQSCWMDE